MRNLATIQQIKSIRPIEQADAIECAQILGWQVVVKKSDGFKVGDLVVYCEIDSIMPDRPEFDFLRNSKGLMQRIRTVKLRGQISQGIAFPLSILPSSPTGGSWCGYFEGQDVTEVMGVTKWEVEIPTSLRGSQRSIMKIRFPEWMPEWARSFMGRFLPSVAKMLWNKPTGESFPSWIPKTDETRVQVLQSLLASYEDVSAVITEKLDGSSVTCYLKDGEFGVCSRNIDLKKEAGNAFWDTVIAHDIEKKMRAYSGHYLTNFAIQGELIGEGIQGNKYKLKGKDIRFFNVFNIDTQRYLSHREFRLVIEDCLKEQTVPILEVGVPIVNDSDFYVQKSEGRSVLCDTLREGIVIRPLEDTIDFTISKLQAARVSFKAVSPTFLLKSNDN